MHVFPKPLSCGQGKELEKPSEGEPPSSKENVIEMIDSVTPLQRYHLLPIFSIPYPMLSCIKWKCNMSFALKKLALRICMISLLFEVAHFPFDPSAA